MMLGNSKEDNIPCPEVQNWGLSFVCGSPSVMLPDVSI